MSDLIECLRATQPKNSGYAEVANQAADEIERLCALLEGCATPGNSTHFGKRTAAKTIDNFLTDLAVDAFLSDLTKISRKHGIALTPATMYRMEPEDRQFQYKSDDQSVISL